MYISQREFYGLVSYLWNLMVRFIEYEEGATKHTHTGRQTYKCTSRMHVCGRPCVRRQIKNEIELFKILTD